MATVTTKFKILLVYEIIIKPREQFKKKKKHSTNVCSRTLFFFILSKLFNNLMTP